MPLNARIIVIIYPFEFECLQHVTNYLIFCWLTIVCKNTYTGSEVGLLECKVVTLILKSLNFFLLVLKKESRFLTMSETMR